LVSKLWDEKNRNSNINTDNAPLKDFFCGNRPLKLVELRRLFQSLIEIYKNNRLTYPVEEQYIGDVNDFTQTDSKFNIACSELEKLEDMNMSNEAYGLGHCHTAEIALTAILTRFNFFSCYQLVTLKRIEYESARNLPARYIKDMNILERKEDKNLLRYLKYDNAPAQTYSVFFRNKNMSVNLFPFLLDYNALTNEFDSQVFLYECVQEECGLRYFSLQSEDKEIINYNATSTESRG
jgi:hypothetical protein